VLGKGPGAADGDSEGLVFAFEVVFVFVFDIFFECAIAVLFSLRSYGRGTENEVDDD